MKELHEMQAALDTLCADFDEYKRKAKAKAEPKREPRRGDVHMSDDYDGFAVFDAATIGFYANKHGCFVDSKPGNRNFAFNVFDVAAKLEQHDALVAAVRAIFEFEVRPKYDGCRTFEATMTEETASALAKAIHTEPKTDHE